MPETVNTSDVASAATRTALDGLHTCIPAIVQAYYTDNQTVDVLPVVRTALLDENGEPVYEDWPVIPNVPLGILKTNKFVIHIPVEEGDTVMLYFSEADFGIWRDTGQVSNPSDLRRHGVGYPVAVPCIVTNTQAKGWVSKTNSGTKIIIGSTTTVSEVQIDESFIQLGHAATDFVALASKVDSALTAIQTAFDAHSHTGVAGSPVSPANIIGPLDPTGSELVKAL